MSNSVVIVGPSRPCVESLAGLWGEMSIEVKQFPSAEEALHDLRDREAPEAVLISYPLWDMSLADLYPALQRIDRHSHLIVMSPAASLHEVAPYEDLGVILVSTDQSTHALRREVQTLVGQPSTRSARFMVRMEVQIAAGRVLRACQSENISETGMLIRTNEEFPLGASIQVEFVPPGQEEPVKCSAEVVRYTSPDKERIRGMGIRFVAFEDEGDEILGQALRKQVS